MNRVRLEGVHHPAPSGAAHVGRASPDEILTVTVVLRPSDAWRAHMQSRAAQPLATEFPSYEGFASTCGADDADTASVEAYLRSMGLEIVSISKALHLITARGAVAAVEKAFDVELHHYRLEGRDHLQPLGDPTVPSQIADKILTVLGLDARPAARRVGHAVAAGGASAAAPLAGTSNPQKIAALYDFPPGDGTGRRIAFLEFGGGYDETLLGDAFQTLTGGPAPSLSDTGVLGAQNQMYSPNYVEVLLDIQVAGAVAPKAEFYVVFAPNQFQAWILALDAALAWPGGAPDAVSISWGAPESAWSASTILAMEQAFQSAGAMGVTILTTSGDTGVTLGGAAPQVGYPASSQYALACGGTQITTDGQEIVWNDSTGVTGGGISQIMSVPEWQQAVTLPPALAGGKVGRGVPDVAGNASGLSGYSIMVAPNTWISGLGTSAVAPLYAALVARLCQASGRRVGFLNPHLYAGGGGTVAILSGNNSVGGVSGYAAGPGWNACAGLGRINGAALASRLAAAQA
jgi:kumamolisin